MRTIAHAAPFCSHSSQASEALAPVEAGKARQRNDRRGGNARMEYHNSQGHAHKVVHAPTRELTREELAKLRDRIARGWDLISAAEKSEWGLIHHAEAQQRAMARLASEGNDDDVKDHKPLWQLYECRPHEALPPAAVAREHQQVGANERRQRAWQDPSLRVSSPVEPRVSTSGPHRRGFVFGCAAEKNNVCREVLPRDKAQKLEEVCHVFNA